MVPGWLPEYYLIATALPGVQHTRAGVVRKVSVLGRARSLA